MPNIVPYLNDIMAAVYGEQVRGAIHDAISEINNEVDASTSEALKTTVDALVSSSASMSDDMYTYSSISGSSTENGYKLVGGAGLKTSNSSYKLVKYPVTAGNSIRIVVDDKFQFQSSATVPSSGSNNNLVGQVYGACSGVIKVPTGAAYVILSTLASSNIAAVYNAVIGEQNVQNAVDNWLDEHPEATTSVQDGSLTQKKLVKGTLGFVTPEMFGAKGDGTTDDTSAINNAIDYATLNRMTVYLSKSYKVTTVLIKNGLLSFVCNGTLIGSGGNVPVLAFEGYTYGNDPVEKCNVTANIDMSAGNMYGIRGMGIKRCTIHDCNIYGIANSTVTSRIAISIEKDAEYNQIVSNKIIGYENPNNEYAHIGIRIMGDTVDWGGFYDGEIVDPTLPARNNIISNNTVVYGETAVDMLGCEYCNIQNNNLLKQSTRAIYAANSTNHCLISGNSIIGFKASAILLGYCCHNNTVSDNNIKQISGYNNYGGEAAINIVCGCAENIVSNNLIDTFTNYGIYLAIDAVGNTVIGNSIKNYYLAAITLENDWVRPLPAETGYSRPNYGAPAEGDSWAHKDCQRNVISGNTIFNGYPDRAPCAIYVSQLGTIAKTIYNIVSDNNITMDQLSSSWSIRFVEQTVNYMTDNVLENNKVKNVNVLRQYLSRGKSHFSSCKNNDGIDTATISVSSGTTVDVGKGAVFILNYTNQTTVTNFVNGNEGQEIFVKLGNNVLLAYSGSAIVLKDKTNVQGSNESLKYITFKKITTVWVEIARNF